MTHRSLAESVRNPQFLIWDFAKLGHPAQLHALWQALYKFGEKVGRKVLLIKILVRHAANIVDVFVYSG